MRMDFNDIARLDLVPQPLARPVPTTYRIGLVGAGRIVHSGVMPAYRSVGITPVAAADPDPEARRAIQALWGIPRVFETYDEMFASVELDVVDVNIRWDVGLSPTRVDVVARAA